MVQHCRDIYVQKYKWHFLFVFLFPCLSKVFSLIREDLLASSFRLEVNLFNFQFRFSQNFLPLNQYADCVKSKSCKVRFFVSLPAFIYRRTPISYLDLHHSSFQTVQMVPFLSPSFRGKSRILCDKRNGMKFLPTTDM